MNKGIKGLVKKKYLFFLLVFFLSFALVNIVRADYSQDLGYERIQLYKCSSEGNVNFRTENISLPAGATNLTVFINGKVWDSGTAEFKGWINFSVSSLGKSCGFYNYSDGGFNMDYSCIINFDSPLLENTSALITIDVERFKNCRTDIESSISYRVYTIPIIEELGDGSCLVAYNKGAQTDGVEVLCPSGYTVTGGGWADLYNFFGNEEDQDVSLPLENARGWRCEDHRGSLDDARCYAICCKEEILDVKVVKETGSLRGGKTAFCDYDESILGGGFVDASSNNDDVDFLMPVRGMNPPKDGWECREDNSNLNSECYGVCGKAKEGYELTCETKTAKGNQNNGVFVECDDGYFITGGGFGGETENNDDQDISRPKENGWYCKEDNSINNASCYARCCKFELKCTPNLTYTDWSDWEDESECRENNTILQSRYRVEYDENNCGGENNTYYEYKEIDCDFCTPNIINATGDWEDLDCIDEQRNQSRMIVEYDENDCGEIENNTYYEYRLIEDERCEIECYINSDCGENIFGNRICSGKDVVRNLTEYACINPGTTQSYCSNSTIEEKLEECDKCENGACKNLSCVEAKNLGLISGQINGGNATVINDAHSDYKVGMAVYKMFDNVLANQELFDSDTGIVNATSVLNLNVDLPDCKYQLDLFCGDVLPSLNGTTYGSRLFEAKVAGDSYCEHECTPNLTYTDWSDWEDLDCIDEQRNQSRYRVEYDINNCGFDNVTDYEYRLIEDDECIFECEDGETQSCDTGLLGVCGDGIKTCSEGSFGECEQINQPSEEICNSLDDDCDGEVDEGGVCEEIECIIDAECEPWPWVCKGNFCFDEYIIKQKTEVGRCINYKCEIVEGEIFWQDCRLENKVCVGELPNAHCANPPECSVNEDCGNSTEEKTCSEGDSYNKITRNECKEGKCAQNVSFELIEDCGDLGCYEGECVQECEIDEDCGEDGIVNNFCEGDDLMSNYSMPYCGDESCNVNYSIILNQTCEFGCSNDQCNSLPECSINEDCGSIDEELVCKSGDVYNKITTPICLDSSCSYNISYELEDECKGDETCKDGECEEDDDDDEDNSALTLSYCGDLFCDSYRGENSFNCAIDCGKPIENLTEDYVRLGKKASVGVNYPWLLIFLIISVLLLLLAIIYIAAGRK